MPQSRLQGGNIFLAESARPIFSHSNALCSSFPKAKTKVSKGRFETSLYCCWRKSRGTVGVTTPCVFSTKSPMPRHLSSYLVFLGDPTDSWSLQKVHVTAGQPQNVLATTNPLRSTPTDLLPQPWSLRIYHRYPPSRSNLPNDPALPPQQIYYRGRG